MLEFVTSKEKNPRAVMHRGSVKLPLIFVPFYVRKSGFKGPVNASVFC
jgi:hypothetical protein